MEFDWDSNSGNIADISIATITTEETTEQTTTSTISTSEIISFNRPNFTVSSTWDTIPATFPTNETIATESYSMFITRNDSVYIVDRRNNRIRVWPDHNLNFIDIIAHNFTNSTAIFVANNGDIFVDNGDANGTVYQWMVHTNISIPVMYVNSSCYGLFVDITNTLYCSIYSLHKVVKRSLRDSINTTTLTTVAGNGTADSTSDRLSNPAGIFVDDNFELYVADYGNDRVLVFQSGNINGTTRASSPLLNGPSSVVLDGNKYLYIVDSNNHRIVRSTQNGFRCIIGCYEISSGSSVLSCPWSMAFDARGNIYVVDRHKNQIRKFLLLNNTMGISHNQPNFDKLATWNFNRITFKTDNTVGTNILNIFVTKNSSIYVADRANAKIEVWFEENPNATKTVFENFTNPAAIYIAINGDILVDNGDANGTVDQWTVHTNISIPVMYINSSCYGLFVDITNTLYCSIYSLHKVIKRWLDDLDVDISAIVAGNGTADSTLDRLSNPAGIFVDDNFELYVADYGNDRVLVFQSGNINGTTRASSPLLNGPSSVVLDGNKYLYIVDSNNHRVIRSTQNEFRCIIGCYEISSGSSVLSYPWSMAFDIRGNIYVTARNSSSVEKFFLLNNTMNISYNEPNLNSLATWNPTQVSFRINDTGSSELYGIFLDQVDSVYAVDRNNSLLQIWFNKSIHAQSITYNSLIHPTSIFITLNDDILVDNGDANGTVDQWTVHTNTSIPVMYVNSSCYGLFVDISNSLYCSVHSLHKVIKRWLDDPRVDISAIVAGNGTADSTLDRLSNPAGIFVDDNFELYVADYGNDRVLVFQSGNINGTTRASSPLLNGPSSVVLDGNKYLYIVDSNNHRVIRSTQNEFRCIIGCYEISSGSSVLSYPWSMAFDVRGNIYVTDRNSSLVEKFLLLNNTKATSYNQLRFCSFATWDENTTTFMNITTTDSKPVAMFITKNNSIYIFHGQTSKIQISLNGSMNIRKEILNNITIPASVYVAINGDILVDNGDANGTVDQWKVDTNISIPVMYVNSSCYGLFVDISNSLYCSVHSLHKVIKRWLDDPRVDISAIVAGNGTADSTLDRLSNPAGIFVDDNFDLYVADYGNDRVLVFQSGNTNGTARASSPLLNGPSSVVLDGNKYLYIVDSNNHRIVRSTQNTLQCIIGCNGSNSASKELLFPWSMAFDARGNIYAVDQNNSRIQKFLLSTRLCDQSTTQQSFSTSVIKVEHTSLLVQSTLSSKGTSLLYQTETTITTQHSSTMISSTNQLTTGHPPSSIMTVPVCGQHTIGLTCNISATPCQMMKPCQNNGTCVDNNTIMNTYSCLCLQGFNGSTCEYDHRPCQSNSCWNNGHCNETSNTTFECVCQSGWTGDHCERKVNHCENVTCANHGVCRPLVGDYKCECLSTNSNADRNQRLTALPIAVDAGTTVARCVDRICFIVNTSQISITIGIKIVFTNA
ncbi:hypothetical protein I4U23_004089 [Adineta vaga]|nr:hypothetical protein I4U23_004089 [Adineta vaga]